MNDDTTAAHTASVAGRVVTVDLGRLGRGLGGAGEPGNRMVYVTRLDAIVAPHLRIEGGWRCVLVGSRRPCGGRQVDITEAEVAHAKRALTFDPVRDVDTFVMVWQSQVYRVDPDGLLPRLATRLAHDVRTPGTLTVHLGLAANGWRQIGTSVMSVLAMRAVLARMVDSGLLAVPACGLDETGWGPYTLTIPGGGAV